MGLDEATRFAGGLTTFWCLGSANDLPVGLDGAAVFSGGLGGEDGDHDHVQVLEDSD